MLGVVPSERDQSIKASARLHPREYAFFQDAPQLVAELLYVGSQTTDRPPMVFTVPYERPNTLLHVRFSVRAREFGHAEQRLMVKRASWRLPH